MKIITILCVFFTLFNNFSNNFNYMKNLQEIYSIEAYTYNPNILNKISIYGTKLSNSPFIQNIEIRVFDEDNELLYSFSPKINYGYDPTILAADFVGNNLSQIFYGASSGGSGGYGFYYVFKINENNEEILFDFEEFSEQNQYSGKFLDNYRAEITTNSTTYLLDVSNMDEFYKNEIYNSDGTVKNPQIDIGFVNTVFPVFNSTQGNWFLQVYQKATAIAQVNVLGYVVNELQFSDNNFSTFLQFFAIFQ